MEIQKPDTYDSPWKDMLEIYLEDFFEFFFPAMHHDVDWRRKPVSLDKELRKIARDGEVGHRYADKLFQLWDRGGEPVGLMVNIEVQGSPEADFAERLFVYNYRAFDRFHKSVVTVAVLCDETESFHPTSFYSCRRWGCRMGLEFPSVKLREYNERWHELEASPNPFATVVMAHLKNLATRGHPAERFHWKLHLIRRLYETGRTKKDILELFRFIDWVMALPSELERELDAEIETIETERGMKYVTGIERRAMARGLEQGVRQGIEQGVRQGIEQGQADLLKRQLQRAFGEIPSDVERRLATASRNEIERWAERVIGARSLDEVFALD